MDKICFHAIVLGRVQGVYYRANTERKALELHLTGWVQNLPDGSVEVLACGGKEEIKLFEAWLWEGPPFAKVENVKSETSPYKMLNGFIIR